MELDRRLLLAHCAAHALSMAAGLLVVVPMALNGSAFKGRCALFSTGHWRTEPGYGGADTGVFTHHRLVVQQWGPPAACQFATFVGIFTVLYGAAQGWRSLFYLHGRHDDTLFSSFLTVLLSVCMFFLSGGASVILSLGLASWCATVTDNNTQPFSCAASQSVPLYLDVDTSSFYVELSLAQASLWCVTLLWLVESAVAFMRLYHSHSGPCLLREKELLLREAAASEGSAATPFAPDTPTVLV
uniref:transmembrane protein 179-like n=1 Tax=Doryrhamphus excisus TaxID=161450 RepID=UPI0025AE1A8E|nr:transmembrane protein 179-like [Doryrhamphus excisus]